MWYLFILDMEGMFYYLVYLLCFNINTQWIDLNRNLKEICDSLSPAITYTPVWSSVSLFDEVNGSLEYNLLFS